MSIPNIPSFYQKIKKGSEGGNEFARVISSLIIADCKDNNEISVAHSDAAGDFLGVDFISYKQDRAMEFCKGFQFKFYPQRLTANQKADIVKSLKKAMALNPLMHTWVLVTPEDFLKNEMDWLKSVQEKYKKEMTSIKKGETTFFHTFDIEHWGQSRINELLLRYPHVGRNYFPELYRDAEGKLFIESIDIDTENSFWGRGEYYQRWFYDGSPQGNPMDLNNRKPKKGNRTSDPLLDVQLINNSENVYLLKSITLHRTGSWTKLKGFPPEHLLKSVGTIKMEVDLYHQKESSFTLPDPLILQPKSPMRFKLQFTKFLCPANRVKFYIRFNLSGEHFLDSKEYTFSF